MISVSYKTGNDIDILKFKKMTWICMQPIIFCIFLCNILHISRNVNDMLIRLIADDVEVSNRLTLKSWNGTLYTENSSHLVKVLYNGQTLYLRLPCPITCQVRSSHPDIFVFYCGILEMSKLSFESFWNCYYLLMWWGNIFLGFKMLMHISIAMS